MHISKALAMNNDQVETFYDDFAPTQLTTGINERIYSLYLRLKKAGLDDKSSIVELGCGVGILSCLIGKKIKNGRHHAADISSASINTAKENCQQDQTEFSTHDVVTFVPSFKNPDFVCLFDILEHIPMDRHLDLFKNINSYIDDHSQVLINIPNPSYLEYDHEYQPEVLQIIDQPLPLSFLSKTIDEAGLEIVFFETYSIFVNEDYQFFSVRKKRAFKEIRLSELRSFREKVWNKLFRMKMNLLYK